jgi:hypothetical protein
VAQVPRTLLDIKICLEGAFMDLAEAGSNDKVRQETNDYIDELLNEWKAIKRRNNSFVVKVNGKDAVIISDFPDNDLQVVIH